MCKRCFDKECFEIITLQTFRHCVITDRYEILHAGMFEIITLQTFRHCVITDRYEILQATVMKYCMQL